MFVYIFMCLCVFLCVFRVYVCICTLYINPNRSNTKRYTVVIPASAVFLPVPPSPLSPSYQPHHPLVLHSLLLLFLPLPILSPYIPSPHPPVHVGSSGTLGFCKGQITCRSAAFYKGLEVDTAENREPSARARLAVSILFVMGGVGGMAVFMEDFWDHIYILRNVFQPPSHKSPPW